MIAELNGLDLLVAGLQLIVLVSFCYFCYLVVRHGGALRYPLPEAGWRSAPERTRDAIIATWQVEPASNEARKALRYHLISLS